MNQDPKTLDDEQPEQIDLPEVLDLLIVGGGPGGTATAFRAKEIGLSALVIDFDDLMKRIRDYSKDKLIISSFSGGDQMPFPEGGRLTSLLQFAAIDKDEMCAKWKDLYKENDIPAQVGVELTSLRSNEHGHWEATVWNHEKRKERIYTAVHIVLAVGRGVPRRFDIPGNLEGICYRLTEPDSYIGAPVCVIGGGTSAAEAVISVSQAKARQQDKTPVYWSYRGDKMPRVSKALADTFFDAYLGNGNIRYYPKSEPVAVVSGSDGTEYLAIRTETPETPSGEPGRHYLEIPKAFCVAAIGEDIPAQFFSSLGVQMASDGNSNRKRMVVTDQLETNLTNVFLVGDILSQSYFQTESFDGDNAALRKIEHRGNIKAALNDGVLVAEVIAERSSGSGRKAPETINRPVNQQIALEERPSQLKTVMPAKTFDGEACAVIRRVLPGEVDENEYAIRRHGVTTLGRMNCDVSLATDSFLSDFHASITHNAKGFHLRDESDDGGVFLRLPPGKAVTAKPGTLLRLGRQFILIPDGRDQSILAHYDANGVEQKQYPIPERYLTLGREADISLDPGDMSLSRRHLAVARLQGRITLKDLNAANGTFVRLAAEHHLQSHDQFKIGGQLFRFVENVSAEAPRTSVRQKTRHTTWKEQANDQASQDQKQLRTEGTLQKHPETGKTEVVICGREKPMLITPGQTLCEIAESAGLDMVAECHAGVCGSDPIRVISGTENLSPLSDEERETLTDLCNLEPGPFRLACVTRVQGPVQIEILNN